MRFGVTEVIAIIAVAGLLILFYGAKKLPGLAKSIAESKNILRESNDDKKGE